MKTMMMTAAVLFAMQLATLSCSTVPTTCNTAIPCPFVMCSNNDTQHTLTCIHTSVSKVGDFLRTRWTPDITANITNVSRTLVGADVTHQMFNHSALSPGYFTFEMVYDFPSSSFFKAACLCHCPCSSTIVVEVRGQDVITKDPIDRSVLLEGMVNFTCSYASNSVAIWRVTDGAGKNTTIASRGSSKGLTYITINTTTIVLEVTGSAERNGSCYRCGLLLDSGNVFSQPGCLYVIGPPVAPTVVLYDRTLTSMTVEWYEPFSNPSAPVLYYEVSIDGGQNRILSSDQRMATFSGLTHNTVYSIAVRANNTVGFGDRGFLNATTVTPLGGSASSMNVSLVLTLVLGGSASSMNVSLVLSFDLIVVVVVLGFVRIQPGANQEHI